MSLHPTVQSLRKEIARPKSENPKGNRPLVTKPVEYDWMNCKITKSHIDEMIERFDSGMFDATTCNAVALALSEMTAEKVVVARKGSTWFATTKQVDTELPSVFVDWLDRAMAGALVGPLDPAG